MQLLSVVGKSEVYFAVRHAVLHTEGTILMRRLEETVRSVQPERVLLDLREVKLMDSFGLYALSDFCRWIQEAAPEVEFVLRVGSPVVQLLQVAGLDDQFVPLYEAPNQAGGEWRLKSEASITPLSPTSVIGTKDNQAVAC